MHQTHWLRGLRTSLFGLSKNRGRIRRRRSWNGSPLQAGTVSAGQSELLEDRTLLAAIVVNSWLDDSFAGDGVTTLREAVLQANSTAGADDIQFHPALNNHTIVLKNGAITVNGLLNIHGPGSELLAISGNHASSVINVSAGSILRMDGLTIRDGSDSGLTNAGVLQITDSVITSYFHAGDVDGDGQVDDLVGHLWNNINLEILDTVMSQLNVDDFL